MGFFAEGPSSFPVSLRKKGVRVELLSVGGRGNGDLRLKKERTRPREREVVLHLLISFLF
jgi:hypothetical protein